MSQRSTDPPYLRYQYGDAEKLRIRGETHRLHSERPDDLQDWVLSLLGIRAGQRVVDVGCGTGWLHPALSGRGAAVVGLDASFGMAAETRRRAARERLPLAALQADAQRLPLADSSFDRAVAVHVLFHVPDVRRALVEMRRVLVPGGRVLVTTNAADHSLRLHEMHAEAARSLGYTPTEPAGSHFTLDDFDLVREVFPTAECHVRRDAFVFREPEPALRFYATGRVDGIREWDPAGAYRPALLRAVRARIAGEIGREGCFRVPKDSGCFTATV